MKVTVNASGEVTLEVNAGEGQAALDLIESLQARAKRQERERRVEEAHTSEKAAEHGITEQQYRSWAYLVDHDSVGGVHVAVFANAFGLTTSAASTRMQELLKAGYIYRVRRGYYRAITGKDEQQQGQQGQQGQHPRPTDMPRRLRKHA